MERDDDYDNDSRPPPPKSPFIRGNLGAAKRAEPREEGEKILRPVAKEEGEGGGDGKKFGVQWLLEEGLWKDGNLVKHYDLSQHMRRHVVFQLLKIMRDDEYHKNPILYREKIRVTHIKEGMVDPLWTTICDMLDDIRLNIRRKG